MVKLLSEIPGNLEPSGTAPDNGGGSGQGDKNYVISPDDANSTQVTGGMNASTTTVLSELPEATKEKACKIVLSSGSIGDKVTFDVNPIDDGDNRRAGTNEIYIKTLGTYTDDDFKVYWQDTTTGEIFGETNIKAGDTYISGATAPLTATNSIVPTIESNVAGNSDGIAVSAVGVLAQTPLVGSLGGWKIYDENDVSITGTNSWNTTNASLQPYKDPIGGKWRIRGNVRGTTASAPGSTVTVTGITFPAFNQAGTVSTNTTSTANECYAIASSSDFKIEQGAARTAWWFSFDVELASKPIWADFDGTVNLGSDLEASNSYSEYENIDTPAVGAGTYQLVKYQNKVDDSQDNYNPSTGIWTCPKDGKYSFNMKLQLASATGLTGAVLKLNDQTGGGSNQLSSNFQNQDLYPTLSDTLKLTEGDQVSFHAYSQNATTVSFGATAYSRMSVSRVSDKSTTLTGFPLGPQADQFTVTKANKWQLKTLPSTISVSTNDILNFNNLVIGNTYKITSVCRIKIDSAGTGQSTITVTHDSSTLMNLFGEDSNNNVEDWTLSGSIIFVATATKIQWDYISVGATSQIVGGGTNSSFMMIEEYNGSVETTDFT